MNDRPQDVGEIRDIVIHLLPEGVRGARVVRWDATAKDGSGYQYPTVSTSNSPRISMVMTIGDIQKVIVETTTVT